MKVLEIGFVVDASCSNDVIKQIVETTLEKCRLSDPKGSDISMEVTYKPAMTRRVEKSMANNRLPWVTTMCIDAFVDAVFKETPVGDYSIVIHTGLLGHARFNALWTLEKGWVTPEGSTAGKGASCPDDETVTEWIPEKPKYKRAQWIVSDHVGKGFDDMLALIKHQKLIYEDWHFGDVDPVARAVVCFYGPPGTGKTMAAHVLAAELGKPILCPQYSQVESKYWGESPKRLRALFAAAAEMDAVLFLDEADSFLGKRIENVEQSTDQAVNSFRGELLTLLENHSGIVILATNLVTNLDKAFESRILKFLEIELPNQEARLAMISSKLPKEAPLVDVAEAQLQELAEMSEGFSGREIRNAILHGLVKAARGVVDGDENGIRFCYLKKAFEEQKDTLNVTGKKQANGASGLSVTDMSDSIPLNNESSEALKDVVQSELDATLNK